MAKKTGKSNNPGLYIFIFLIITSIFIPAQALFAVDYEWVGGVPYSSGNDDWDDPLNWEEFGNSGVPASDYPRTGSDTAMFSIPATILTGVPVSIGSLIVNNGITLDLTLGGAFTTTTTAIGLGTGTIDVSGSNISLGNIILNGNLSVTNTGSNINTGTVNGANSLTLAAGTGNVTLGGAIGGTTPLGSITVISSGLISIGADITTLNANMSFNGPVALTAPVNISTDSGAGNIAFSSTVNGANSLTLAAGTGDVTLGGAVGTPGTPLGTLSITTGSSITLPQINAANLAVTAGGDITQSGVIIVSGTSTFEVPSATGVITLTNVLNNFGTVSVINALSASFTDTNGIILGNITAGSLTVTTISGNISQSGVILVLGTSTFAAPGNTIILTDIGNNFGTVSVVSALSASFTDTNGIILGNITAGSLAVVTANNGDIEQVAATTISVTPGVLSLNAAGAIIQQAGSEINAGNTSSFTAAGVITLAETGNSFAGAVSFAGAAVTINASGAIGFAVSSATGNLLVTAGGTITQSGAITVGGTSNFTADNSGIKHSITLGSANNFTGAVSFDGNVVTIVASGAIQFAASSATTLNVTTGGGNISQGMGTSVIVSGISTFDALGNTITLNEAGNNFGTVSVVSADSASFRDTNGIILGNINANSATGNLSVTAGGAITQSGVLILNGTSSFTAAGVITLAETGNSFAGAVSFAGAAVTINASGAIGFAVSSATGNLLVTAGGTITQSGAITVGGTSNFTADNSGTKQIITLGSANNFTGAVSFDGAAVTIETSGAIEFDTSSATISLSVTAGGDITQSGAITVTGTTGLTITGVAANIILDDPANIFSGAITLSNNINSLTIYNNSNTPGTLNNIPATLINVDLRWYQSGLTLSNLTATTLNVTAGGGNITQVAGTSIIVSGISTFTAGTNTITLAETGNDFGTVSVVSASSASFRDSNGIILGAISAGNLTVTAGGAITQSGILTLGGTSSFTAGNIGAEQNITLDLANNFTGAVSFDGDEVTIAASGAIRFAASSAADNLSVTAGGAITQSGGLIVTGTSSFTADNSGTKYNIILDLLNGFTGAVSFDGAVVEINASGAIEFDASSATGNLSVTASWNISQKGALAITGTTSLTQTAASGEIDLSGLANKFDGNITLTNGNTTDLKLWNTTSAAVSLPITGLTSLTLRFSTVAVLPTLPSFPTGLTSFTLIWDNAAATLTLPAITVANLTVRSAGNIGQGGILTVSNSTSLEITGAIQREINLSTHANVFDGGITVTDNGNIEDLRLRKNTGNATLPSLPASGMLYLTLIWNSTGLTLPSLNVTTLTVTAGGDITQGSGTSIRVSGASTFTAGTDAITLNETGNDFGTVSVVSAASASFRDTNGIILGAITATSLTVETANNGDITQAGSTTITVTTLSLNSANDIIQPASSRINAGLGGTSTFTAVGAITLTETTNTFVGAVSFDGDAVTIVSNGAIGFAVSSATGNLSITAGGAITQSGVLTVNGAITLTQTAASGLINLSTHANVFDGGITVTDNGNVQNLGIRNAGIAGLPSFPATGLTALTLIWDAVGLGLPPLNVTTLNVTANGTITQSGILTVNSALTLTQTAASGLINLSTYANVFNGSITVTDNGNVEDLRLRKNTGNATLPSLPASGMLYLTLIWNSTGLTLPSLNVTTFTVTAGGDITQGSGTSIRVSGASTFTAGTNAITLNETVNDFGTVSVVSAASASFRDTNGIILGVIDTGSLTITAGGDITQNGAITVSTTTTLEAPLNLNIDLSGFPNSFTGAITVNGGTGPSLANVYLRNDASSAGMPALPTITNNLTLIWTNESISLGALNINGNLELTAGKDIDQSSAFIVGGTTTLTAGSGFSINMSGFANIFSSSVSIYGSPNLANVYLRNDATAAGMPTLPTITNNLTLILENNTSINLPGFTIGGNFVLTVGGNINQAGIFRVGGTTTLTTGSGFAINLSAQPNEFTGAIIINGGTGPSLTNVYLRNDASPAGMPALPTITNNLTLIWTGESISLGALNINGNLELTAGKDIDQSSAFIVGGTTTLTAGSGFSINMSNFANIFSSSVSIYGSPNLANVYLRNDATAAGIPTLPTITNNLTLILTNNTSINLPGFTIGGNFVLTVGGNINQAGIFRVGGTTTLTTGSGFAINLSTQPNEFTGAITVNGGTGPSLANVYLRNDASPAGMPALPTITNDLTLIWTNESISLGALNINGNLVLTAGKDIDQSSAFIVGGTTTLTATGSDIDLQNAGNRFVGTIAIPSAVNARILAINDIIIGNIAITGAFQVTASGAAGRIIAIANIGAGSITLTAAASGILININFLSTIPSGLQTISTSSGNIVFNNNLTIDNPAGVAISTSGGSITITGNLTIDSTTGVAISTGAGAGNITFGGTVNSAGTDSLTLTAGAGTIQCNGIVGPALGLLSIVSAGTVNFTQPVQCEEIRQVAGTGTTTFGNIVTISNPTTTTAINLTGTAFTFSGAVTTTGYGNVSITNSGVLTISNTAPFVLAGSFTKNGGGTVTLGADITTANASISFNGAVTLTDPVTLTTNGTTTTNGITFSSAVSGGNNILTIRAGSGAVSLNGIPSSYSSSGTGGGLDVVNSGSIAVAGALSAGSENIKLGSAGAITLNGQVSTGSAGTVTITNAGVLTLNSGAHFDTLAGSLTQNGAGSVTLNANINIITVNQNVAFDSLISGLSNLLTINAGSGAVFLNGIPSSYSSSGTGGGLDVVNSGSIAVAGALSAGSGNIKLVSAGAVTLNGQVSTDSAGTVTITNAGVLTLNSGAHFDTLAGSLTQNGAGGVTLNANINIITVNQNVTFNSLISGSSNLLTINAGSGAVFLNGTLSSYTSTGTGGGLNIANSGSILIAGALSAGGGHLNMVSDGTITLSGTVNTTNNGNVTITNGGLLRINSGANFNLTAGNFLQNGVGDVVCAGDLIVTGTGTITFGTTTDTPPVYFAGNPLNSNFTISASAIKFFGDVHIYLPSRTIFFSNSFTCRNFILYNGTVNLNGATSANKILTTEQDFVAFGAGYTITDSVSSSTNLFAYNNPLRDDPAYGFASPKAPLITASTIHGISFLPIYNTALGGYNNSTGLAGQFAGLSDARIYVGAENNINGNFYVNGCNMNPGSQWELVIPDNGNSANAFAEAYNMSVSNCSVNLTSPYNTRESWVAAGECGPANVVNSPRWAGPQYSLMDGKGMGSNLIPLALPIDWNIATGVDISNSYSSGGSYDIGCVTIFDDVIRIQMNAPLGSGVLFENDNNEISKAVEAGALWINGSAIKTTPFIDRECTTTTDGAGDLAVFYLQVPPADTWNTDATGASSGDPDSTDMSGNKNRGVTPNIYAPKATNTIYFSLLDNRKNRVTHSPAPALFANVADFCRPVVVDIQTGRDQNTLGSTYNWHNYFQITYSEPVDIGTGADVFPGTAVTSVDGGVRATANFDPSLGQYGGHLYESGANTVTMSGYFSYQGPQVKFKSASNDSMPETNSLFRTTATPPAGGVHGLRIYVVGWRANAAPTTPWPGYMWDVFPPEGRDATIIASDMVLDANKNSINIFDRDNVTPKTITITADVSAYSNIGYPKWLQPEIAPYMRVINEVVGIDIREVVILDTNNNGLTDRLEFHIFNPTDPSQKWDTDGHHPEDYGPPMVNTFNNGKGIRESSFDSGRFYDAFRIGYDTDPILSQLPGITLSQFVNNSLFNPNLAAINYADDTYFSITFNDIALQLDSLLPHIFSYESHVGKLTDLAGNLLKSVSSAMTVEVAPPMIQYTIASAGGTKIYVKFSEHVFCADRDILTNKYTLINENHFEIAKPGDAPGSSSSAYRVDSVIPIEIKDSIVGPGVIDAYFILNRPLDPDDLLVEKIRVLDGKVCNTAGLTMMPATQYRISNFAIGLVEPVWAMDNFDVDGSSSANITIRDFAGKDKLRASDITVEVKTNTTNTSLPVTMYFDADPPASVRVASGFWLPTMFRGFNAAANNAARALSPVLSNGALKDFVIPESDNEMTEGKDIEFIFNFAGLYTGYLLDPSDPRTITTWKIPIRGIKKQRGGVTILNNVINVSRGEKAILMYDLPKTGAVTVNIFSLSGDVVKTLVKGTQPKGSYSYTWDGTNTGGRKVARGIYFIRVVGPDIDEYRKVMVVKNR